MNKLRRGFPIGTVVVCVGLLLSMPGTIQAAPKGKVVVISRSGFGMKGGDCHTQSSTTGTTINALINDGLVSKQADGKIHPALAGSWSIDPK